MFPAPCRDAQAFLALMQQVDARGEQRFLCDLVRAALAVPLDEPGLFQR